MLGDVNLHRVQHLRVAQVVLDGCAAILWCWHPCWLWDIWQLRWLFNLLCWHWDILCLFCARLGAHVGESGRAVQVPLEILEARAAGHWRKGIWLLDDTDQHRMHYLVVTRFALDGCVAVLWCWLWAIWQLCWRRYLL